MTDQSLLQETRTNRDLVARVLLAEIQAIITPLARLDERSRAAIIALVGAAQLITAYERSLNFPNDHVGEEFDAALRRLHPEGARLLAGLRTVGHAESVAYAWTLAMGRLEKTDESDAKAARAAAAEVACAMSHLDALMEVLRRLGLPEPGAPAAAPTRVQVPPAAEAAPRPNRADVLQFLRNWE